MNTRLLLLPFNVDWPATCLTLDCAGRILAREQLTAETPASASDAPLRLVVPGADTGALWLPLSARSQAQAQAEARVLAAPQLAGNGEDLHVAVAPAKDQDATRLVVLVERSRLQIWLERARALGVEPTAITPDYLMLPDDEDAAVMHDFGSHCAVRAGRLAFGAEPALARQILGDRPIHRFDTIDQIEAQLALAAPAIDLLQQHGAIHSDAQAPTRRQYHHAAWLAAALALSPAVLMGAQALRYQFESYQLQQQVHTKVADALGLQQPINDPARRAAEAADRLEAPMRFAKDAGALFAAITEVDGAHLITLQLADGRLHAELAHPRAQDVDAVLAALVEAGLSPRLIDSRSVTNGMRSRLQLERRP